MGRKGPKKQPFGKIQIFPFQRGKDFAEILQKFFARSPQIIPQNLEAVLKLVPQ